MIDRPGLADFLRRRREKLSPSEVGLPETSRRRTPGLRREEVAVLAGISSDFYARLEQARGSDPSESVVTALARALRCTPDEKDHLFRLAGVPVAPRQIGHRVDPGLLQLAAHLDGLPTCIHNDLGDVLYTNALDDALACRDGLRSDRDSNVYRSWFTRQDSRDLAPEADRARLSAAHVSDLRATYSRRGADHQIAKLVADLAAHSAEFRTLWDRHDVAVRHSDLKDVQHPAVGLIQLRCRLLVTPETGIRMRILLPLQGTDAAEKLELLRVIGTQQFVHAWLAPPVSSP
ncbi:helix-turn-helix transcriptional regulator [Goodfellowiella coeruleoviolacea]|uniref:Helix-turn-helix domain-containing protein n=1 Tax=Goodfellowiella coeruleoviolacea TaxID=334858 RepID=A0AAE3GGR4_9PSEU|nr:helix-turn-helix transcriptional regulator [Goodfellowiella coeruleoviolacea]MCP2167845.1 Helix-turn-helix domain-containing protein [Goodfellowiella coeruleoviolacea]